MRLRELINERITSSVFHITSTQNLVDILNSDILRFSKSANSELGDRQHDKKKYPFYLSLARSINSGYIKTGINYKKTIIEFDGEKLSANHKGKPVGWIHNNSYEERKKKAKRLDRTSVGGSGNKSYEALFHSFDEAEDRLYSKKKEGLSNVIQYIKAIHILHFEREKDIGFYSQILKKTGDKVPVFVYFDRKDILSKNKRKAKQLKDVMKEKRTKSVFDNPLF